MSSWSWLAKMNYQNISNMVFAFWLWDVFQLIKEKKYLWVDRIDLQARASDLKCFCVHLITMVSKRLKWALPSLPHSQHMCFRSFRHASSRRVICHGLRQTSWVESPVSVHSTSWSSLPLCDALDGSSRTVAFSAFPHPPPPSWTHVSSSGHNGTFLELGVPEN